MIKRMVLAFIIIFSCCPSHASSFLNQKIEGGVLNLGDYAAIIQSRLTDVKIQLFSNAHIGLFGVQFEGHTTLNVDGKYYVGGKAIREEFTALSKKYPDRFKFHNCRFNIPEEGK